jgi:O-methyltransferase
MDRENEKLLPGGKFNSSWSFPHDLPYQEFYAEKVPLLNVFRMVLGHFVVRKLEGKNLLVKIFNIAWPSLASNKEEFLAVECGVYKGNSLIACAEIARDVGVPFHFFGLDTFNGLPPLSKADRAMAPADAPYLSRSMFDDTSMDEVQKSIEEKGLDQHVSLLKGLFKSMLPILSHKKFRFVSIDCDLYEPHRECLEFFYPRMERGGVIFFDDYYSVEFPMARIAVDEFLADKSESLLHLRYGDEKPNHTKAFIVKH